MNTVPDRATIEIDRRVLPGEDRQAAYRHVVDYLARSLGPADWIVHDPPYMQTTGLADQRQRAAGRASVGDGPLGGRPGREDRRPFGTNAAATSAAGIPSVVFGPGSIAQAHTADEWLALDQLALAAEVYYRFAAGYAAG